jgi:hypothetical protein
MRGFLVKGAVVLVLAGFGWHEVGTHHIGAPADPYGPCPAGSHYFAFWQPGTAMAVQGGVIHYHGWTEIASCSATLTITGR